MTVRQSLKDKKRWVVKIGSALLTNDGEGLSKSMIECLAKEIAFLRDKGIEVILVSSGSVAAGFSQLGMTSRPEKVNELQAAAAVGQASLVRHYEEAFKPFDIPIAQVLLTHADIANRERYLNAQSALTKLLELGVLSVVNENDTVATEEICFGDNDNLAALVANLVGAQVLVILTDQDGLYTADPRSNPDATLLNEVDANDESLLAMASGGSSVGRGGMVTKLTAAQTASLSGASTVIASGREPDVLSKLYQGEQLGTLLRSQNRLASKKQWVAGQMKVAGSVVIDDGAEKVLLQSGSSLLTIGVLSAKGEFQRGQVISCINSKGVEVARGLSNYSASDVDKIKGKPSSEIFNLLGYGGDSELIHRDNLVVI